MKLQKLLNWRAWLRGLWSSIVQGGSSAVLGSLGLLGANLVGAPVAPLDYKQAGGVFLGAAIIRMLFYLQAHPLPEEEEATDVTTIRGGDNIG